MSSKNNTFKFDKFMKDISTREAAGKDRVSEHMSGQDKLPQREYNRRYRELWQNSVRYGGKGEKN